MKRFVCTIICVCILSIYGCATKVTLGPKPTAPQDWMRVTIDSVPDDADVYTVDKQGELGEKLGTTPLEIPVGFARTSYSDGTPCPSLDCISIFAGSMVSMSNALDSGDLLLHVALVNGETTTIARNLVLGNGYSYPPPDIAIIIPVEKISDKRDKNRGTAMIYNSVGKFGQFYTRECTVAKHEYKRAISAYNEARDDSDLQRRMQDERWKMRNICKNWQPGKGKIGAGLN